MMSDLVFSEYSIGCIYLIEKMFYLPEVHGSLQLGSDCVNHGIDGVGDSLGSIDDELR